MFQDIKNGLRTREKQIVIQYCKEDITAAVKYVTY